MAQGKEFSTGIHHFEIIPGQYNIIFGTSGDSGNCFGLSSCWVRRILAGSSSVKELGKNLLDGLVAASGGPELELIRRAQETYAEAYTNNKEANPMELTKDASALFGMKLQRSSISTDLQVASAMIAAEIYENKVPVLIGMDKTDGSGHPIACFIDPDNCWVVFNPTVRGGTYATAHVANRNPEGLSLFLKGFFQQQSVCRVTVMICEKMS